MVARRTRSRLRRRPTRRAVAPRRGRAPRLAPVAPALVVVAFVALYPLLQTVYLSFTNARLASAAADRVRRPAQLRAPGATTPSSATRSSPRSSSRSSPSPSSSCSADHRAGRQLQLQGRGVMRAAMLVPWAILTVVSAQMWKWMYHDVFGVINDLLVNKLHIFDQFAWMARTATALWASRGRHLEDDAVRRAAPAGRPAGDPDESTRQRTSTAPANWQQFWRITLPLLKPAILVTLIFRTLDALRVFDVFYVMFGAPARPRRWRSTPSRTS